MALGTTSVSGISSGIDWQAMIEELRKAEYKRIDLVAAQKESYQARLTAWQEINTKLLSLKTAAGTLNNSSGFNLFISSLSANSSIDPANILGVTAGTSASTGSYDIVVNRVATAQKLSSTSFADQTAALNLAGDIIVGGRTVSINAADSLLSLKEKFNAANSGSNPSGVTASVVNYGSEGYRLILTSDHEGAEGISLLNGGNSDLLSVLGFVDNSPKTAKNVMSGGHKSDLFTYDDKAIGGEDLLALSNAESGTVTISIDGTAKDVDIDLAADSLTAIKDAINAAFSGVFTSEPASVVSETEGGVTRYRLLIEGHNITYTDDNNILETLGILERAGVSDERGLVGDLANTANGVAITSATRFDEIDGYLDYTTADTITLSGTDTDGNAVNTSFAVYDADYKTVGDLLAAIESSYGNVSASITADGRIQVVDNETGDTDLTVNLTPSSSTLSFDTDNDLGEISTLRKRQLQAGTDAEITVDGVTVTSSSNTVDDVIPGVTLNLLKAAQDTTVTVTVARDYDSIMEKIQEFVSAYNEAIEAINAQMTYDVENEQPGGPLFGDSSLRTVKSSLTSIVLDSIQGVSSDYSTLGLVGIHLGADSTLSVDEEKLRGYLESNFEDVKNLFAVSWSATNSNITYVNHSNDTQAGTYDIHINSVDPVDGYFVNPGDAEGNGEYLKGISGDAKGLFLRYSGTATGDVGSITLTFGVAELLDRALYHITDPTDGQIANKEETIQDTIDRLDDRIGTMEDRLDRKMELMVNQFLAMEKALSTLQSQSNWLAGQLNAAANGWQ
ncbi:MAG: flagellar filament capping protein FliD [Deltaproteobacteria bacterium]|nr:flagellar filament capping protein FliD [Deltaproteobacteria bacterium]